jgi:small ligand-binding sensory domain FIST
LRWSSAVSDAPSFTEAVHQASEQALEGLDGASPDLALAFVSSHQSSAFYTAPELLGERLGSKVVIGCSAAGVIGAGHEVEKRPGVAVSVASLPGVKVSPFLVGADALPGPDEPPEAWRRVVGAPAASCAAILTLPDPFTLPAEQLIAGLDYAYPSAVKIGGLVSGGSGPGTNAMFIDGKVKRSGAVGVAFSGNLDVKTVVAQGCRPVGRPLVVTECERNVIRKLGDKTPLEVIRELFDSADARDRRLIRRSLQIGLVMDPLNDSFAAGDFLIRNVIGADEADGALAVGEMVSEGQVVQFHVRDAEAADEDLRAMLDKYAGSLDGHAPSGGLLFQCLGRGQLLFGAPDHDTELFKDMVSPIPLAGFFCNGEIGPVGGTTFLHGYTSSFALFSPRKNGAAR